jgi:hypothetical protein
MAAEASATTDFGTYEAFPASDLTMAFCRPPDWQRIEDRLPGFFDGFQSSDGTMGVYCIRYSLPGSFRQLENISAQIEDLTITAFAGFFPAAPAYVPDSGTAGDDFMDLNSTESRWYDYGSGRVRVAAGVTNDGSVLVGMVFGPYEWFAGQQPNEIIKSMIQAP